MIERLPKSGTMGLTEVMTDLMSGQIKPHDRWKQYKKYVTTLSIISLFLGGEYSVGRWCSKWKTTWNVQLSISQDWSLWRTVRPTACQLHDGPLLALRYETSKIRPQVSSKPDYKGTWEFALCSGQLTRSSLEQCTAMYSRTWVAWIGKTS